MTGAKIAIVGAGLIGRRHADVVAREGVIDAFIDPTPEAEALAAERGSSWFPDLRTYLRERRPDGAIVATPNQLHSEHGLTLIEAGIPVLMEKPIADTTAAASELVTAATKAEVPLLIGHHRRHNPIIAAAKQAITSGRLGSLVSIHAQFSLYKPDEYFDQQWRKAAGAGPVFVNLIHDIDLIRHFAGDVRRVHAVLSNNLRGNEVEDNGAIILEMTDGALVTILVSDAAVAPWSWEFTARENPAYPQADQHCYAITGTHGSLSVPDLKLWSHPQKRGWWEPMSSEDLTVTPEDPLVRQFRHFLDVIAGRSEPLVSGTDGLMALRVVEAIMRSADTGLPQEVENPA